MLDESLLDNPDALARNDTGGLLLGVAAAGARVRAAARRAAEAGLADVKPDGRPRTVLVAGPGPAPGQIADLLGALAACPVLSLPGGGRGPAAHDLRWTLPGWAGAHDLLLLVTPYGTEPGLTALVEQTYRRDCAVAAVAPVGAPLGEALRQVHGLALPFAHAPYAEATTGPSGEPVEPVRGSADPGAFWAMLTPLLGLADRIGLFSTPPDAVQAVADRLDQAAERFGPATETYRNPAKALAAGLVDAVPLVWSEGAATGAVARRFAALLTTLSGRPALTAALPGAVDEHRALIARSHAGGIDDLDDFFRDRVDEPAHPRPRIVLLREPDSAPAVTAREAAGAHDTPLSEIDAPPGSPAESLAELLALTDFAAVYLALACGAAPFA